MSIHPDLGALYICGSVLVTVFAVYVLHAVGSAIGRAARRMRLRREAQQATR